MIATRAWRTHARTPLRVKREDEPPLFLAPAKRNVFSNKGGFDKPIRVGRIGRGFVRHIERRASHLTRVPSDLLSSVVGHHPKGRGRA